MLEKRGLWLFLGGIILILLGFTIGKSSQQTFKPQSLIPETTPSRSITSYPSDSSQVLSGASSLATVTKVIDGDTIQLENGKTVRYIGIDTPETVDPRKSVQCYGQEASSKNRELVEGRQVRLEKDVSETDKYGRLLRYIFVDGTFVNDYLVRQGYAYASSYPPDVKYQEQFIDAQREARENKRGLWSACGDEPSSSISGESKVKGAISGDMDCSDFPNQEQAQAFFISQGGPEKDPHRLDQDHDGIACESLPR